MGTTVSSKGQVVIPQKYRQAMGITPGSTINFDLKDNVLELRIVRNRKHTRLDDGHGMLKHTGTALPPDFDVATLLVKAKK